MTGAQPCAIVAIEIFQEKHVIAEVRVVLEQFFSVVYRPLAVWPWLEKRAQPCRKTVGRFIERNALARTGRKLDLERIAIVVVEALQSFYQQEIHREPNWPSPIRVSPKSAALRFGRFVVNLKRRAFQRQHVRVALMVLRKRSETVRRQEFTLIEHALQDALEPRQIYNRQQPPLFHSARGHRRQALGQVRTVVDEPLHALAEPRQPLNQLLLDGVAGNQRQQPDHRSQAK